MTISLEGIEFFAYHGVYPEEQRQGNHFVVSVSLILPDSLSMPSDHLSDTVDYQQIYQIVAREMAIRSNLIEHVAFRIKRALEVAFPDGTIHIKLSKQNPPVGGKVAYASVEL